MAILALADISGSEMTPLYEERIKSAEEVESIRYAYALCKLGKLEYYEQFLAGLEHVHYHHTISFVLNNLNQDTVPHDRIVDTIRRSRVLKRDTTNSDLLNDFKHAIARLAKVHRGQIPATENTPP